MPRKKAEPVAAAVVKVKTLGSTEAYMDQLFEGLLNPNDRATLELGMARCFALMHRAQQLDYVDWEVIPGGQQDWGTSSAVRGWAITRALAVQVTTDGLPWIVHPDSETWVFDNIHEKLDEVEAEIQEQKARALRRSKALDKARAKLTAEELELLGVK